MNVHLYTYKNVKPYAYIYIHLFKFVYSICLSYLRNFQNIKIINIPKHMELIQFSERAWTLSETFPWRLDEWYLYWIIVTNMSSAIKYQSYEISLFLFRYLLDISILTIIWVEGSNSQAGQFLVGLHLFRTHVPQQITKWWQLQPRGKHFWGEILAKLLGCVYWLYHWCMLNCLPGFPVVCHNFLRKSGKRFLRTLLKKRVDTCWPNSCRPWTPNKIFHVITSQLGSGLSTVELAGYWVYHVPQWVFQHFPAS